MDQSPILRKRIPSSYFGKGRLMGGRGFIFPGSYRIEVLVGCREGEADAVRGWLESFPRLPLDDAISSETVRLRQRHGLKVPDAIILATARCSQLALATRNSRDFPLSMGGVLHPYQL